jgi:flagellar motor switch protein FliM
MTIEVWGSPVVIEIDPAISQALYEKLLGSPLDDPTHMKHHDMTHIEEQLLRVISVPILEKLSKSWSKFGDCMPKLIGIESNPQYINCFQPTEMTCLITLEAKILNVEGMINVCYTADGLSAIDFDNYDIYGNTAKVSRSGRKLTNIDVDVSCIVGATELSVRDVLNMKIGDTVMLNTKPMVQLGDVSKLPCELGTKGRMKAVKVILQHTDASFAAFETK